MKVLFTFYGLPHYYISVLNKLNSINSLEIVVVVPKDKGATLGKGVKLDNTNINFKVYYTEEYTTYYKKPFLKGLKTILSEEKPDIIVTLWPYILGFVFYPHLLLYCRLRKIKLAYKDIPFMVPKYNEAVNFYRSGKFLDEDMQTKSYNGFTSYIEIKVLTLIRKYFYNMVNANINYIEEALDILGSYGVKKEKIFITYNSPDTDALFSVKKQISGMPPLLPYNKYRIIHVGRLVKWKKVDLLIKVFAKISKKYKDSELIIIGTGPEEQELKTLAQKTGFENNIKFIGGVYDTILLGRYFMSSSIYVIAGMGGLSINEAMSFGKPVICSVCDGTEKMLVKEGYNGMFFENGNEDSLFEKIDYLFSNYKLIETMGENSEKTIKEKINIHTIINGYVKAFNYVTNDKYKISYTV